MPLQRHISNISLLFTSLSCMIGSGWLFGAYYTAQLAGPASILSWIIGGALIIMLALCFSELGTMLPVAGGIARYTHFTHGSMVSFAMSWLAWLSCVAVAPTEVQAILQYASHFYPWLTHSVDQVVVLTNRGYLVAACMLILLSYVNTLGIDRLVRCNNWITSWKLLVPAFTALVLSFGHFSPQHILDTAHWMPYGWHGVFASLPASVVFSYLGFREATSLAGETKNPRVAIPLAVIGSVIICMLIYVFIQVIFVGLISDDMLSQGWAHLSFEGDSGPFAAIALSVGMTWLAYVVYADAGISPTGAGLIYTATTARISYAMSQNNHVPRKVASLNKKGVPSYAIWINALVGLVLFFPFPGWQALIKFQSVAIVLAYGVGPICLYTLRTQAPDFPRPFRLPCYRFFSWANFFICNLLTYWAGWLIVSRIALGLVFGFCIFIGHRFLQERAWTPIEDYQYGMWMIVHVLGMLLVSHLGMFDGQHVLSDGIDYMVLAVWTTLIFWWATRTCLPRQRTEKALAALEI